MLTNKQRVFIAEYTKDFNGTKAAERAGYKGSTNTLAVTAHDLLRNPKINQEIQSAIDERCMSRDEVLIRLARHARGSMSDFLEISAVGDASINFKQAHELGAIDLVKKVTETTRTYKDETTTTVTVELYDAQAALVQIGRHHKLFTDRQEVAGDKDNPLWIDVNTIDYRNGLATTQEGSIPDSDASGES